MIVSMTGFGDAQVEEDGHVYHVEVRSVNNRYLKTTIRVPDEHAFLEAELEPLVRQRVQRGSITLRFSIRDLSAAAAQDVNHAAIQQYLQQLLASAPQRNGIVVDLATLATLPGVVQPRDLNQRERERLWATVSRLSEQALERLAAMRREEGRALAAELTDHCNRIRAHLAAIRQRGPRVIDEYRQRLMARIQELLVGSNVRLAEDDLLREVAVYADRSDISEEISRLESHLAQFDAACAAPASEGRKLEFIAQEMLREANTMGSKSGDAQIARDTIEIKSAIDRIKEQVQNVE
jgi:uncharacterized protein (TIGR00255 family)